MAKKVNLTILRELLGMKHRLKEMITERGLKIRSLAREMGEEYSEVYRVINGERKLSIEWLLKFCSHLNAQPTEIVDIDIKLPTTCDQALLGSIIGFVFDACEEANTKKPKELASWISFIYDQAVTNNLTVTQTRNLAKSIVEATQESAVA